MLLIYFSWEDWDPLDLDIVQSYGIAVRPPRHSELDSGGGLLLHVDLEPPGVPLLVSDLAPGQVEDLTLIPGAEVRDGDREARIEGGDVLYGEDGSIVTKNINLEPDFQFALGSKCEVFVEDMF